MFILLNQLIFQIATLVP